MSRLADALHRWFVPSHKNNYHPHLLAERGLLALFALILGAEGFLVSNLIASLPGAVPLAAAGAAHTAYSLPPAIAAAGGFWSSVVVDPLAAAAAAPNAGRTAFFILICASALLMGVLALTLSARRRNLVPIGYIAGGTMLALAAAFIAFDTQTLLPAAVALQTNVVRETASPALAAPHVELASSMSGAAASSTASSTAPAASSTPASSAN